MPCCKPFDFSSWLIIADLDAKKFSISWLQLKEDSAGVATSLLSEPLPLLGDGVLSFFFFFFLWRRCEACGILVPPPGIEPGPSAVKAWSPNRWPAREFPEDGVPDGERGYQVR